MSDPYSFQALSKLDAEALRQVIEVATVALKHRHVAPVEACQFTPNKRAREEDSGQDPNESAQEELNKVIEMRASEEAGDYMLDFGKHSGTRIRQIDPSYLYWMLGLKRKGQRFIPNGNGMNDWMLSNKPTAVAEVRKYLTWRCWVCRSTDTKFKWSSLCRSCFLASRDDK